MLLNYYLDKLGINEIPNFLKKYLESPSLQRLKKVGYLCGMDYASKDVYNISEYISRYDHSLSVALLTYRLTKDKKATIAALFHDIATPCFSHVIDYMNDDYVNQESTEVYTEEILLQDSYILSCFNADNILPEEIINFKRFSIVDNKRPKLCADRLDGVILTDMGLLRNISKEDIDNIIDDIGIYINEDNEEEIGFATEEIAIKVVEASEEIDRLFHSNEDNYMMVLLSNITKIAIQQGYINYRDLYSYNEEELFNLLNSKNNPSLIKYLELFKNIKKKDIPAIKMPSIKARVLNPIVNGRRLNNNSTFYL